MDQLEVAWAAGFFDGEGSIGAWPDRRYRHRINLQMSVVQSGLEDSPPAALTRFQVAVGGLGQIGRRKDGGRLGTKPMWYWHLGGVGGVKTVVALLLPHLTVKVDQIAEAMALRHEYEGLAADRALFCKRGHVFTPENTYIYKNRNSRSRLCRACNNEKTRQYRLRRRSADSLAAAERVGG